MACDDRLFFTCSLIEYIGRITKNRRSNVVDFLGERVSHIYEYADVLHLEPIAKVADDFIRLAKIPNGNFDNIAGCKYAIPDYWDIGDVYRRIIEDNNEGDIFKTLISVYHSTVGELIQNFNSDLYYQPRDYLSECYRENTIISDD